MRTLRFWEELLAALGLVLLILASLALAAGFGG